MGAPALAGVGASGAPPANDLANAVVSGVFSGVGPGLPFAFVGQCNALLYASINTTLTTTAGSNAATVAVGTGIAAGASVNSVNVPPGTTWATFAGTSGTLALPTQTYFGTINSAGVISGLPSTAGLLGATVTGPGLGTGVTVTKIITPAVNPPGFSTPITPGSVQLSAVPSSLLSTSMQQAFAFALTANSVTTGADASAIFTGASATFVATVQLERCFDGGKTWFPANIGGAGVLASYSAGTPVSLTFGEPERGVLYRWNCLSYTSGTINYRLSATGMAGLSMSLGTAI